MGIVPRKPEKLHELAQIYIFVGKVKPNLFCQHRQLTCVKAEISKTLTLMKSNHKLAIYIQNVYSFKFKVKCQLKILQSSFNDVILYLIICSKYTFYGKSASKS